MCRLVLSGGHLADALHAWCGAHLLRDLKDVYEFEPREQDWAQQMAALLIKARDAARDARAKGKIALPVRVRMRQERVPCDLDGHTR